MLRTRARAKINLTLDVLGRLDNGYHDLDSLVAFAGVGDELSLQPGPIDSLVIRGPFAAGLEATDSNLVLKAMHLLRARRPELVGGSFLLTKRLPVASGIGGGSADAAAALRLLARANRLAIDHPDLVATAREVGADVPVCLASKARMMSGAGETLGPVLALPSLFAVLVNPGVGVATAAVFAELGLARGMHLAQADPPMPGDATHRTLIDWLSAGRNDLEAPARRIAPVIDEVLARLSASDGCRLARMSGSGATCFGLFDDCRVSAAAARQLCRLQPDWWVKPTVLR